MTSDGSGLDPLQNSTVIDLFAGPGGWEQGMRLAGLSTDHVHGFEWDTHAVDTARAAGLVRHHRDVRDTPPSWFAGVPRSRLGLVASPPCQSWSSSGRRGGKDDRANCHRLLDTIASGMDALPDVAWADERSALVVEPVKWIRDLRPQWVAMEQVPSVIDIWEHVATVMEQEWGYRTWCGVVPVAEYGVSQTRRRAVLVAHRRRGVHKPAPTHSPTPAPPTGSQRILTSPTTTTANNLPHVPAMADVIGWGYTNRVANTIVAGPNGKSSGAEWGGSTVRRAMYAADATARATGDLSIWMPKAAHRLRDGIESDRIRVSVTESSLLQGFPANHPWRGNQSQQLEQIGNAIPPPLAAALLREVLGLEPEQSSAPVQSRH